jgi:endonuclease G
MKFILYFAVFISFTSVTYSQAVSLDSIVKYEGKNVMICEVVQSTYQSKGKSKTTYLNFGKPFPNATFTAVIFESNLKNFDYNPSEFLKGKTVCITGVVKFYNSKPQFVVVNKNQIVIQDDKTIKK